MTFEDWTGTILSLGARLPIAFKSSFTERLFRRLVGRRYDREVDANLGVDNRLKWRIPVTKAALACGVPSGNLGERATLDLVGSLCQYSDGFVDVGANYGLFAVAVRCAICDSRYPIVCLEADPELAARLSRNASVNSLNLRVLPAAAGSRNGSATFLKNLSDDSCGSLTDHFAADHTTREITVETVRLADILDRSNLREALVKVDVEGAGTIVWEGLAPAAASTRFLVMEVIGPEALEGLPARIVGETGWRSYYIEDYVLRETSWSKFRYVPPFWNWLLCRDSPAELRKLLPRRFSIVPAVDCESPA